MPAGDVRYIALPLLDIDVMVDMPARVHLRSGGGDVRTQGLNTVEATDLRAALPMRRPRAGVTDPHLPGEYWCSTVRSLVVHESQLELARLRLADFDPDVVGVVAQPCTIEVRVDGRVRRQTLDYALFHRDDTVTLVNVKPAERLTPVEDNAKVRLSVAWPAAVCAAKGWRYEVWCGASATEVVNIRTLSTTRVATRIDSTHLAAARERHSNGMTVGELEQAAGGWLLGRPAVLHMLWQGELQCDLTRPLSGSTMLFTGPVRAGLDTAGGHR